jgi:hypothetical protein
MTTVLIEPRWTYREAGQYFGCDPRAVTALARRHGLECPEGKPLDQKAMLRLGEMLNLKVTIAQAS